MYFVATKLEAFRSRGKDDYMGSHDLEDVVAIIDGRPEIVSETAAAPSDVREFIAAEIAALLEREEFVEGIAGFLLPDAGSQRRAPLLRERLRSLARAR